MRLTARLNRLMKSRPAKVRRYAYHLGEIVPAGVAHVLVPQRIEDRDEWAQAVRSMENEA